MDKFEALRKYKELLDDGIITQEDFNAKKEELLATHEEDSALGSLLKSAKETIGGKTHVESVAEGEAPTEVSKSTAENSFKVMIYKQKWLLIVIAVFLVLLCLSIGRFSGTPKEIADCEGASINKIDRAVSNGTSFELSDDNDDKSKSVYGYTEGSEFCGMKTDYLEFYFINGKCAEIYIETTYEGDNIAAVEETRQSIRERFGGPGSEKSGYSSGVGMNCYTETWDSDTYCTVREDNVVLICVEFQDF